MPYQSIVIFSGFHSKKHNSGTTVWQAVNKNDTLENWEWKLSNRKRDTSYLNIWMPFSMQFYLSSECFHCDSVIRIVEEGVCFHEYCFCFCISKLVKVLECVIVAFILPHNNVNDEMTYVLSTRIKYEYFCQSLLARSYHKWNRYTWNRLWCVSLMDHL